MVHRNEKAFCKTSFCPVYIYHCKSLFFHVFFQKGINRYQIYITYEVVVFRFLQLLLSSFLDDSRATVRSFVLLVYPYNTTIIERFAESQRYSFSK